MITKEQIQRINELYKKQVNEGLTEEEKIEQQMLRRLYVEAVKENLRAQLENIKIVDEKGYKHNIQKKCGCDEHKH
ncbi:DUF896 domain-containing protein [Caloramator sp. E03]|uniref:DUF896 domain-containing protein n=1 Tax=Caloramator sp. E03 TaxID=2576307 RepID=UPI001110FB03|nr:DUF896 domain-containing protein [Caloramator sp. E03]